MKKKTNNKKHFYFYGTFYINVKIMLSYPQNQFEGFLVFFFLSRNPEINIKVLLKLHAWVTKKYSFKK